MRSEKYIRAKYDRIKELWDDKDVDEFFEPRNKSGWWLEFLEWILEIEDEDRDE